MEFPFCPAVLLKLLSLSFVVPTSEFIAAKQRTVTENE
jgi:hypothetical protein